MGQANRRGTYEERKTMARIAAIRADLKTIDDNTNHTEQIVPRVRVNRGSLNAGRGMRGMFMLAAAMAISGGVPRPETPENPHG